jgi:hypothetical protein
MAEVVAQDVRPCSCGKEVAWLPSLVGAPRPIEIRKGITVDAAGKKTALVDDTDLHDCGPYPRLAGFIREAIARRPHERIRIHLQTKRGDPVAFLREPRESRVSVTNGREGAERRYYGSLGLDDGGYRQRLSLDDLRDLLEALNRDPAAVARGYGEATSSCCFCNRTLTDERSVEAGYGPVCAAKYGLPWG